eukprot:COSAG05_NODE_801_length_7224_cov_4.552000_7_plen_108_part_00
MSTRFQARVRTLNLSCDLCFLSFLVVFWLASSSSDHYLNIVCYLAVWWRLQARIHATLQQTLGQGMHLVKRELAEIKASNAGAEYPTKCFMRTAWKLNCWACGFWVR